MNELEELRREVDKLKAGAPTQEAWNEVGAVGKPAFENSWVNFGSTYATAAYMKDNLGFVHLKGTVRAGTVNATIFTLPTGYRPDTTRTYAVPSNALFGIIKIDTDGTVILTVGSNVSAGLGITFRP